MTELVADDYFACVFDPSELEQSSANDPFIPENYIRATEKSWSALVDGFNQYAGMMWMPLHLSLQADGEGVAMMVNDEPLVAVKPDPQGQFVQIKIGDHTLPHGAHREGMENIRAIYMSAVVDAIHEADPVVYARMAPADKRLAHSCISRWG